MDSHLRPNRLTPVILACEGNDSVFLWEKETQGFIARRESSKRFSIDMLSYFLPLITLIKVCLLITMRPW